MSAGPDLAGSDLAGLLRWTVRRQTAPQKVGARYRGRVTAGRAVSTSNWVLRPLFGLLLAAAALAALIGGGAWFAGFIALGTIAGVREWHRMVRHGGYGLYVAISATAIAVALALPVLQARGLLAVRAPVWLGLGVLVAAAFVNLVVAGIGKAGMVRQAFGSLYLGVPGVALFALRATPGHGLWLVLMLFAAVWATDTGALVSGKLIGGPRLAPALSPNKTWAGLAGGTMMAGIAVAAIALALGASVARGAGFGIVVALVGGAGDLFESWIKRQVGRKNSGHLIPGHGGVLDRIDSILFAAPACAAFVFLFGAQSIFGVTP